VNAVSQVFKRVIGELGFNEGITDRRERGGLPCFEARARLLDGQPGAEPLRGRRAVGAYLHGDDQEVRLMPETKKAAMETLEKYFSPSDQSP
jgi:hypothetical protein